MSVRHEFSNRVAFVIGGTSGIGLATARGVARSSAAVVVAARDPVAGERAKTTLRHDAGSSDALFVSCDVRDEATVERAVRRAVEAVGRFDFAVNCPPVRLPPSCSFFRERGRQSRPLASPPAAPTSRCRGNARRRRSS
jgi:NAD(P)-dependent dehydrogenase (short-subunit alcohol dehydrogenase family)